MTGAETADRKPRIAIMGEFSAGKSTLSNLLLGERALPEKVTATRLPPIWMVHGSAAPYRVDADGNTHPVVRERLEDVPLEETLYVRLCFEAEVLEHCDLIDFPGISDPNMGSEVWERMLGEVDGVLWCTHATQAWRQSEAAVWEMIPEDVRQNSLLLITRFDKLITDSDRMRVRQRVAKETAGLFAGIHPISLTQALAAEAGDALWDSSGADGFYAAFVATIERIAGGGAATAPKRPALRVEAPQPRVLELAEPIARRVSPLRVAPVPVDETEDDLARDEEVAEDDTDEVALSAPDAVDPGRIIPRRVRPSGFARTPRPGADEGQATTRERPPTRPLRAAGGGELDGLRSEFRRPGEGAASS